MNFRFGGNKISEKLDWEQINIQFRDTASHFLLLVDLLLTIPAHSSECERGFSLMKLVKTDWRNCLTDEAVTDLIRIILHSAGIKEYNPDQVVHQWRKASIRGRRPNQKVWKKKKDSKGSQQNEMEDSKSDSNDDNSNSDIPDSEQLESDESFLAMFESDSEDSDFDGF